MSTSHICFMLDGHTHDVSRRGIKRRHSGTKARMVFDGVVVPTLAMMRKRKRDSNDQENTIVKMNKEETAFEHKIISVKTDPELEAVSVIPSRSSTSEVLIEDNQAKEDFKKLTLLKNPKLKRNEALAFLPQTLRNRLLPIGFDIQEQYFTIDQVTREVLVTRLFISKVYGGNYRRTFARVSKEKIKEHGMSEFMFMIPTSYQPEAPQLPGAPGLRITPYLATHEFTARVFVKIVDSMYQYQGMYEAKPANPPYLAVDEYLAQTQKFRDSWPRAILTETWGRKIILRVLLRKELKREPTQDELQEAEARYPGCIKLVSAEDIKAAYAIGEEKMGVWTMKCVGYENHFQSEMSEKYPVWQAQMDEEQRQKKKEKKKATKKKATSSSQAKDKPASMTKKSTKGKSRKVQEDFDLTAEASDGLEYVEVPAPSARSSPPIAQQAAAAEESSDELEYVDDPPAAREIIELMDSD